MDLTPHLPQSTSTDSLRVCLAGLAAELSTRYEDDQTVPSAAMGTKRFQARQTATGRPCLICMRHYDQPLSAEQLAAQRVIISRISRDESAHLCAHIESRLEPEAHYIVSSLAGTTSLHQVLRQQRRLDFESVCQVLSGVATALEHATAARWPRAMLDAHALFLASADDEGLRKPVKLLAPPLPGLEITPGAACIPQSSGEYVTELALLACELLGMPARRQRFRPLPQLNADTNQLLRNVIEGGSGFTFESASQFVSFMQAGQTTEPTIPTANFRMPPSFTTHSTMPTLATLQRPVPSAPSVPPAPPVPGVPHVPGSTATVAVAPPERTPQRQQSALPLPPPLPGVMDRHIRLEPLSSQPQPTVALFLGEEIRVGRGVKAPFVTRFMPQNTRNDERTRLISREHLVLQRQGSSLWLSDLPGVHQSFISGRPLDAKAGVGRFCRVSISGEFELEIRRLESWWTDAVVWQNPSNPPVPIPGAILLAPGSGAQAFDFRTLWLFTDAAFGIGPNGTLSLQPASLRDVLGWFVAAHDGFWIVAAENDGSIALDGKVLAAASPMPLQGVSQLRIGAHEWQVQPMPAAAP